MVKHTQTICDEFDLVCLTIFWGRRLKDELFRLIPNRNSNNYNIKVKDFFSRIFFTSVWWLDGTSSIRDSITLEACKKYTLNFIRQRQNNIQFT